MNNRTLPSDELQQFLVDVTDQIQYKPIRKEIEDELKAHIEDRTYDYITMGMSRNDASHQAIEQMGDAVSIGIMMNDTRHVRNYRPLIIMVMICVFLGAIRNFINYPIAKEEALYDCLNNIYYFLFGLIVLIVTCHMGYLFVVKNSKWLMAGFILLFLMQRISFMLPGFYYYNKSILVYYSIVLFGPILAVSAYHFRNKGKLTILLYFTALTAMLILLRSSSTTTCYYLTAEIPMLVTSFCALCFMIIKGYFSGNRKATRLMGTAGIIVTLLIFLALSFPIQKFNLELFFHPERQTEYYWEDGYNGVLIKELLNRSKLIGPIDLSKEELYHYGTGAWFYDKQAVSDLLPYRHFSKNDITLTDILPQHYHNNYRITLWILSYGWLPSIILIGFVIGLYIQLYWVTHKIKNKLGKTLAFSCSICLTVQMVLYLLGNLGYQYGLFCTLPFISEGLCSITTNMILVGLVLSAYRFDHVVNEDKIGKKAQIVKYV